MAILIDPPAWPAHGTMFSHLVSDSDYEELHAFAARLRMPRRAFDLDHYDVPASLYEQALALGALPVTAKDVVHQLRNSGLRVRQVERETVTPVRRRQYLEAEWALLGDLVLPTGRADEAWLRLGEELAARWNEPHRAYHDERHLEDVLLALDHLSVRGERLSPTTMLAAWFHDAVYDGRAGADEQDSAQLAVESLGSFGLEPGMVQSVGEFIVSTTPGSLVDQPAEPLMHLLDADLAIFAASPGRYEQYSTAVRLEYAHVADPDFAAGRASILEGYLRQGSIYRTGTARRLWEERARVNLAREIGVLESAIRTKNN